VTIPCAAVRGYSYIRPPDQVRAATLRRNRDGVWPVLEFVEGSRGNELPGSKNGNQEEKQDDPNEPKARQRTVPATSRSAAVSGLAVDSIPQQWALAGR
jgi:hypothetical protein